jgi:O-antigen/teichoic acid export membrane protein
MGQGYSILIGVLILPLFLQHIGAEAYGLVGFFTLIGAWMQLLDLGMTPTLGREVARLKEQPNEHWRLLTIVNSLERIFVVIALIIGGGLFLFRGRVVGDWLTFDELPESTVATAIAVIAVTISLRWISSLNKSGINAYEEQAWLNTADIVFNTLRSPVALVLVILAKGNVLVYFYFQMLVVLFEFVVLRIKLRKLLPTKSDRVKNFSWPELKRVAPFALSVGYTGAIWVLLTQLDKLLLSKVLPLGEFGYFTLVAVIVSGLTLLAGPINKAILPRMTALLSTGETQAMLRLYRRSTRFVIAVVAPVTIVFAMYPEVLVFTWTGDRQAAAWAAPVLPLFATGTGLLTIIAFQYYLQYAYGIMQYHVAYNTFSVIVNVPLIIYLVFEFGVMGAAWLWFGFRLLSFLVWVPFVHHKFAPGLHLKWLFKDVMPGVILALIVSWLFSSEDLWSLADSRVASLALLTAMVGVSILVALGVTMFSEFKQIIFGKIKKPNY